MIVRINDIEVVGGYKGKIRTSPPQGQLFLYSTLVVKICYVLFVKLCSQIALSEIFSVKVCLHILEFLKDVQLTLNIIICYYLLSA